MLKMMRKSKKGFTLTELIVVIAILGVLAAVVTPSVLGYIGDAKDGADKANLATLDNCAKRLLAKGTLDSLIATSVGSIGDNSAAIIAAIQKEVDPIPTPNDATNKYWLLTRVITDGEVTSVKVTQVSSTSVSDDSIILNPAPAATATP